MELAPILLILFPGIMEPRQESPAGEDWRVKREYLEKRLVNSAVVTYSEGNGSPKRLSNSPKVTQVDRGIAGTGS